MTLPTWTPTAVKLPPEWVDVVGITPRGNELLMRRRGLIWMNVETGRYVGYSPVFWRAITEEDGK